MDSFAQRTKQHDTIAIPLVTKLFNQHGFERNDHGFEHDSLKTRRAISKQRDVVSRMLNYRPDMTFTKTDFGSIFCEVKSEGQERPNFAIEFNSWVETKTWNSFTPLWDTTQDSTQHVIYAFVDTHLGKVSCCWADSVSRPSLIIVPKRPNFKETLNDILERFPKLFTDLQEHTGHGSGTPYFLLSKNSGCLVTFDTFIKTLLKPKIRLDHSGWPPVYASLSKDQLEAWIDQDNESPNFLSEKQRRRYELRVKGVPEEKWPADVWPKRNEKR